MTYECLYCATQFDCDDEGIITCPRCERVVERDD